MDEKWCTTNRNSKSINQKRIIFLKKILCWRKDYERSFRSYNQKLSKQ